MTYRRRQLGRARSQLREALRQVELGIERLDDDTTDAIFRAAFGWQNAHDAATELRRFHARESALRWPQEGA